MKKLQSIIPQCVAIFSLHPRAGIQPVSFFCGHGPHSASLMNLIKRKEKLKNDENKSMVCTIGYLGKL